MGVKGERAIPKIPIASAVLKGLKPVLEPPLDRNDTILLFRLKLALRCLTAVKPSAPLPRLLKHGRHLLPHLQPMRSDWAPSIKMLVPVICEA